MITIAPNYTQIEHLWTTFKLYKIKKQFNIQFYENETSYKVWGYDGPEVHFCTLYKGQLPEFITSISQEQNDSDRIDFESNFKALSNDKVNSREILKLPDAQPFSCPTFRTKRDSTAEIVEIAPGETKVIDYILTEERYVHGGSLVSEGSQLGDFISAEVIDVNGLIPAPYRAALCEAWPVVVRYINKEWITPTGVHDINTYPLNAKVTQGLVLRINYTAINQGTTRKLGVNYFLTKKL